MSGSKFDQIMRMSLNDFPCTRCHADAGTPCVTPKGDEAREPHKARSLSVRLAAVTGRLSPDQHAAVLDYQSPVPLHPTGAAAALYGLRDVAAPGLGARRKIERLRARLIRKARQ